MEIGNLNYERVRNLSQRDALWEVASQKAEEAEIEGERQADRAKGKPAFFSNNNTTK